ncbi:unnamed protein product [Phyllotreta striolata]|uniref:Securin n=1 Tax=Phyllotreta striolata TaxID=444603 RepID=A0A9N9TRX0_PHYSR|nr:unnamed protein product [Phyllotreta striolata]
MFSTPAIKVYSENSNAIQRKPGVQSARKPLFDRSVNKASLSVKSEQKQKKPIVKTPIVKTPAPQVDNNIEYSNIEFEDPFSDVWMPLDIDKHIGNVVKALLCDYSTPPPSPLRIDEDTFIDEDLLNPPDLFPERIKPLELPEIELPKLVFSDDEEFP